MDAGEEDEEDEEDEETTGTCHTQGHDDTDTQADAHRYKTHPQTRKYTEIKSNTNACVLLNLLSCQKHGWTTDNFFSLFKSNNVFQKNEILE